MPQIGNISAKKFDGVTAVVLTAIQPNAGDQPAVWQDASGLANAFRIEVTYSVRKSADGRSKRVRVKTVVPQLTTNTTTGLTSIANRAIFETTGVVPGEMPLSAIKDAYAIHISSQIAANGTLAEAASTGTGCI